MPPPHPLPPPHLHIAPITPTTLPSYRRLITLLLPIRYPDAFFHASIANPTPSSLALCATWSPSPSSPAIVIGGIQCRLDPFLPPQTQITNSPPTSTPAQRLYIQTLAVLAPYRGLGVATALLDAAVGTALRSYGEVKEVGAHVWVRNEEVLEWYVRRGFRVEEDVEEGYYTKLRPGGARVVRRGVGVGDYLRAEVGEMVGERERGTEGRVDGMPNG